MFIKNQLFLNDKEGLHHAYLITGDIEANIDKLQGAIENIIGTDIKSYPDYYAQAQHPSSLPLILRAQAARIQQQSRKEASTILHLCGNETA